MKGYIKSPCRYCEDRTATCHCDCERYMEYLEINDKDTQTVRGKKQVEWDYRSVRRK